MSVWEHHWRHVGVGASLATCRCKSITGDMSVWEHHWRHVGVRAWTHCGVSLQRVARMHASVTV
eukprot:366402-Chlamydomonas_euryale.AAC.18